jgi:hypothetical protein
LEQFFQRHAKPQFAGKGVCKRGERDFQRIEQYNYYKELPPEAAHQKAIVGGAGQ